MIDVAQSDFKRHPKTPKPKIQALNPKPPQNPSPNLEMNSGHLKDQVQGDQKAHEVLERPATHHLM